MPSHLPPVLPPGLWRWNKTSIKADQLQFVSMETEERSQDDNGTVLSFKNTFLLFPSVLSNILSVDRQLKCQIPAFHCSNTGKFQRCNSPVHTEVSSGCCSIARGRYSVTPHLRTLLYNYQIPFIMLSAVALSIVNIQRLTSHPQEAFSKAHSRNKQGRLVTIVNV